MTSLSGVTRNQAIIIIIIIIINGFSIPMFRTI